MMLLTYQHSYSIDDINKVTTDSKAVILKGMETGSMRPVVSLTGSYGQIMREAYGLGVPRLSISDLKAVEASDPMIYLNVDSLINLENKMFEESNTDVLIKQIYENLDRGFQIVLESKDFYMEEMEAFIDYQFPNIKKLSDMDNPVMIEKTANGYTMERIHPTDLLLDLGVPYKYTTEATMKKGLENIAKDVIEKANEEESKASKATMSDRSLLRFAINAYDANPSDSAFGLRYNSTHVKVWSKKFYPFGDCVVAWRGTDDVWDWGIDLGSQFAWGRIDRTPSPYEGYGPRTFVNRVNSYDSTIHNKLKEKNCKKVYITGHSLGGAATQIHGVSLAANNNGSQPYLLKGIVSFNSPNAVTSGTRTKFRTGRSVNASQGRTFNLSINGRTNDVIVNRVPFGFTRLGTTSSIPVNSTRIKSGETMPPRWQIWRYIPAAKRNHDLPRWYNDL